MTRILHEPRRRFIADETGSELVEIALSCMVLFVAIFGVIDCSRALYADHYVSEMAQAATRYAMVRGATWSKSCVTAASYSCNAGMGSTGSANITSFVKSVTPMGFTADNLTVTSTWPGTTASGSDCSTTVDNIQGCVVTVKVSYSFNFVLPFLPKDTLVLASTSSLPIQQ